MTPIVHLLADVPATLQGIAAIVAALGVMFAAYWNSASARNKAENAEKKAATNEVKIDATGRRVDDVARQTGAFGEMSSQVHAMGTEMVRMASTQAEQQHAWAAALARSEERHTECERREADHARQLEELRATLRRVEAVMVAAHPDLVRPGE